MFNKQTRVIVAEDDYLVGEAITRALEQIGCRLMGIAPDGISAVEMASAIKPDVILMDIQMPEINGLEATRRIQKKCPTPVVILTAYESQELLLEATGAGVSAYLTKPPKPTEIERAIAVALARHGDLMELRRLNSVIQAAGDRLKAKSLEFESKNRELETKNAALLSALDEIEVLRVREILPLCSYCKRVRNDEGYWERVDVYINEHTPAEISHGICPECKKKYFPEYE
jgi:DNA-binding response OmpR family regulator